MVEGLTKTCSMPTDGDSHKSRVHAGRGGGGGGGGGDGDGGERGGFVKLRFSERRMVSSFHLILALVLSLQGTAQGYQQVSMFSHVLPCVVWRPGTCRERPRDYLSRKRASTLVASQRRFSPTDDDEFSIDKDLVGFWKLIGLQNETVQSWNGEEEMVTLRADGQVMPLYACVLLDV